MKDPADIRALIDRVVPAADRSGSTIATFIRGVTAGALIGAAIAGSALLQRQRMKRSELEKAGAFDDAAGPLDGPLDDAAGPLDVAADHETPVIQAPDSW